ncbi:ABC transporter ATP-binding protein [Flavobacterium sangjuense]|uniref:Vitamin B12 import ATP-binding protein BtuD n=1 Tax=Flavobacterium sangjuense TaxID=2518177 RepID=A0A4P7PSH9_9FLAO|nr:ABC transporter ATP-binding protein [Flavobacterium sangjuense]QBZ97888.1 Vitamin B12 import ATP-binding protein BtuD [Flavobacterium sangjuense]
MSKPIIHVENLSKAYQIGQIGTGTISRDIERFWLTKILGKDDPFLKIGETNDRSLKGESDIVWSLKDINFEINQGDAVGIIGKNGAGKSTLLKLLSRVTSPTTGEIKVKGRIASLLEVGTGFHPELSGRENIYLNGAILGMRKKEITRKLDEIIDFSGVERYIDTPVKRYSSGMYVRLAFAVAAHLESEILIVDEVLAVGDAEFQKKCLGKMGDISKGQGRTVLFVSHNMAAVKSFCSRGIVLENGLIKKNDTVESAVGYYLMGNSASLNQRQFTTEFDTIDFTIHSLAVNVVDDIENVILDEYQEIELNVGFTLKHAQKHLHVTFVLNNEYGEPLFTFSHINAGLKLKQGLNHIKCKMPKGFLNIGSYYLSLFVIEDAKSVLFLEKDILPFTIQEGERPIGSWMGKEPGFIKPIFDWKIN